MQTGYQSLTDNNALEQAMMRSLQSGNRGVHSILKEAQALIHQQQSRIEELTRIATTDELTGIMNRRGFMQAFERELDSVGREKNSGLNRLKGGILLMIDLDSFKAINDTHGHGAGDAALKLVAKTLKMDIRKMDAVGRLGGDEFVVLFTNTTKVKSLHRIQNIIKKLNNISFIWNGAEIDVRASVGIKEYRAGDKVSRIFSAADSALYDDKARDKSTMHSAQVAHA